MYDLINDEHVQPVIENGRETSANGLTSFRKDDCIGKDWCSFACILEKDFYAVSGQVYGYGVALLGYDHQQVEAGLFNITIDVESKHWRPQTNFHRER